MSAPQGRTMSMPIAKLLLSVKTEQKLTSHHERVKQIKEIKLFAAALGISAKYFLTILRKKKQKACSWWIETIMVSSMCCMLCEWKVIYHIWNKSCLFFCFTVCNNPYNLSVKRWETVPPLAYECLTHQIGCIITEGHLLLVYAHRQSSHFGGKEGVWK